MSKILRGILLIFAIAILSISTASALKYYTSYTYVRDTHPDIAYYDGYVSVRGADWIQRGLDWCYPKYSKITYRVPNMPDQSRRVDSTGPNDTIVRTGFIRVYDSPDWLLQKQNRIGIFP